HSQSKIEFDMKASILFFGTIITSLLISCGTTQQQGIPTSDQLPQITDNYSIVWVGSGESFLFKQGKYIRSESNDYAFEVVQRRYGNSWKSVKNMHRLHPDYDGKAGPREQTLFFGIDFKKEGAGITSSIRSTIGGGKGQSDTEFREQSMELEVEGISSFAPYNTIRITQHYQYEKGQLLETVELFKRKDGKEFPFAKIEEKAMIFRPTLLTTAPTTFAD
ncbi:MAG: hypothetical protein KTR30_28120, partial [Saprospiraceae bacterium]|nr:hypothetical protein [Saprospiraceae bacterium]